MDEVLGRGQDHVAYLVDDSLVVRFASGDGAAEHVTREARLLELVASVTELAVPVPVFVQPDLGGLVYELLPGVPLIDVPAFDAVSIARELGRLLQALHAIEPGRIADLVGTDNDPPEVWLAEAAVLHESVAAALPAAHAPVVERFLQTPPPPPSNRLVFSHNDLGIEHVLVDPATLRVTGIIDWSDAALCDPAYDFGLILRDLGPEALRAAVASYGGEVSLERTQFYARCALLEDLAYGIAGARDAYVTKSLAALAWIFAR